MIVLPKDALPVEYFRFFSNSWFLRVQRSREYKEGSMLKLQVSFQIFGAQLLHVTLNKNVLGSANKLQLYQNTKSFDLINEIQCYKLHIY